MKLLFEKAKRRVVNIFLGIFVPSRLKGYNELRYWKKRKREEGVLSNVHYEYFYTTHFGIEPSYYNNKTLLDIGCGPRGSLEWANVANRRIGLDTLAKGYLELGADKHTMEYIASPSERIPLKNGACHAVFSFNSLDHVEDVEKTIKEIKRVISGKGIFLLLVEVNHPPNACEPHNLSPKYIVEAFKPEFSCQDIQVYKPKGEGIYDSIHIGETIIDSLNTSELGYFSGRFIRSM